MKVKISSGRKVEARQLHAAPRDLVHRDDGAQRRELDELHEVGGKRRQRHADRLRQHDAPEGLDRREPQHLGRLAMAFRHGSGCPDR